MGTWAQRKLKERQKAAAAAAPPNGHLETKPQEPYFPSNWTDLCNRRPGHQIEKAQRNLNHWRKAGERIRIRQEAHEDHVTSPGEVVALTDSRILDVDRGDSLSDPKIRPHYVHPAMKRWTITVTPRGHVQAKPQD